MKRLIVCLTLLIPAVSMAEESPSIKPGLWQIDTVVAGQPPVTMKQCIDAKMSRGLGQEGMDVSAMTGGKCKQNAFEKQGDNYISETDCTTNGMRMITKTVLSGDFKTRYTGETITHFEPPIMGMSEQKMKMTARWLGPCTDDMKAGDLIMPDGTKMNINAGGVR